MVSLGWGEPSGERGGTHSQEVLGDHFRFGERRGQEFAPGAVSFGHEG